MRNLIHRNIFFNLKIRISSFKVIKFNKLFLEFFPVMYLKEKNIFFNQIINVKKIIYFI